LLNRARGSLTLGTDNIYDLPTQYRIFPGDLKGYYSLMRKCQGDQGRYTEIYPAIRDAKPGRNTILGGRDFGKTSVVCCLRGSHCQWGKYGDLKAVVLQLLKVQTQTRKRIRNLPSQFILELSFTEHNPIPANPPNPLPAEKLEILEPPSLKHIKGQESTQHRSKEASLQPKAGSAGASVEVGHITSSRSRD